VRRIYLLFGNYIPLRETGHSYLGRIGRPVAWRFFNLILSNYALLMISF